MAKIKLLPSLRRDPFEISYNAFETIDVVV